VLRSGVFDLMKINQFQYSDQRHLVPGPSCIGLDSVGYSTHLKLQMMFAMLLIE